MSPAASRSRSASDEHYVINICDKLLGLTASRNHRFDFLRGDPGKRGKGAMLPVDAFYPELGLVIEYHERQHHEAVAIMDAKYTVSDMPRGQQRRRYDQRRLEILPRHNLQHLVLDVREFAHDGRKRLRRIAADEGVICQRLAAYLPWDRPKSSGAAIEGASNCG